MNAASEQAIQSELTAAAERSARYLNEVLLQPEQVNEVVLTAAESTPDTVQHPHGDY